jgi:hypothetical protein
MVRYILPALLLATPALAQQAAPLTADQWKAAAQSYRSELLTTQGQLDDAAAQVGVDTQQITQLQAQLAAAKGAPRDLKK